MIVYNSPDHVKERQNVSPLTLEQEVYLINELNEYFEYSKAGAEYLQRFVWNYENMKNHIASCPNNIINNFEVKL